MCATERDMPAHTGNSPENKRRRFVFDTSDDGGKGQQDEDCHWFFDALENDLQVERAQREGKPVLLRPVRFANDERRRTPLFCGAARRREPRSSIASSSEEDEEEEEDSEEEESEEDSEDDQAYSAWVRLFCDMHPFLLPVPLEFLEDNFSLQGLSDIFKRKYKESLHCLRSTEYCPVEGVWNSADTVMLYFHIHARYIQSIDGMDAVKKMYDRGKFGHCPRVHCDNQPLLPIKNPDNDVLVSYCVRCNRLLTAPQYCQSEPALAESVAYFPSPPYGTCFGDSFPELFLMHFPRLRVVEEPPKHVCRIYGYKLRWPPQASVSNRYGNGTNR